MNAVAKPRLQGQRSWTDAQRAEQSAKLRARQIWLKSTGPRTEHGKSVSSKNSRHPDYDQRQIQRAEMVNIRTYLRAQKSYTDLLRFFCKQGDSMHPHLYYALEYRLYFLENELIDIERKMFDGMTFYEIAGLNNRTPKSNIIPFYGGMDHE